MMEGGVIKSDAVRHPLAPLHPATRAELLALARDPAPLALTWTNSGAGFETLVVFTRRDDPPFGAARASRLFRSRRILRLLNRFRAAS